MTPENTYNVKPLTSLHYVAPANPSGEQPGRNSRRYKRAVVNEQPEPEKPEEASDDGGSETLHVIDYCA
jgi:hypothetical protein